MNHRPACRETTIRFLLAAAMCLVAAGPALGDEAPPTAARWEGRIAQYEQRDRDNPPPTGEVLFVGSSSIGAWNTQRYFPDIKTIQRGFGGSQITDSVYFAPRIVLPYRPRAIVFYAGDNDIAAGKSPREVLADYKRFVARVHAELPDTRIIFVAIKPSIARWRLVDKMRKANAMVEAFANTDPRLFYVDVDTPALNDAGRPRKDLLKGDGLHLTHEGYLLWSSLVRPYIFPTAQPPAQPGVDWLTPRIMEAWPGGELTVRVRLPQGAEIAWTHLPEGITPGEWQQADGQATGTLTCCADLAAGIYDVAASTPARKTQLTMKLDVASAAEIESAPYTPGEAATISVRTRSDEPLMVRLSVPEGSGKVEPGELAADWRGAEATFTAAEGANEPIELTVRPAGAPAQTHWLRPKRVEVAHAPDITLDGDLADWPAAAHIDPRGLETTPGFAPGICLGWTDEGLYLAVQAPADAPRPADAQRWWASSNVEIFVDTSSVGSEKWDAATSRQYYFLPIREQAAWQAVAGQYLRDDAKGSSVYPTDAVRAAIAAGEDGWTIEAFIPAAALGKAPAAGETWRVLLSANSVEMDEDSFNASWPRRKPKDLGAGSSVWGQVRFGQ